MTDSAPELQPRGPAISRRRVLQTTAAVVALDTLPPTPPAAAQPVPATATATIKLRVNGAPHALTVDPRQSLLDVLREKLDLPGTKKGCNQGACGACTVLLDGKRIVSCLTLAAMHDGAELTTIEGLAKGDALHPLQAAFIEHDGLQCGFCTPGQIVSGVACIAEGHAGSPEEVKFWMSGNICRCGAYPGIVAAVTEIAGRG
ncbi:(2Fe-2S)-binding protein [Bosea sp. (in: a-proteobacteria)]|uniref:(2Fe-2S)-binding protein n=1 Tax=Bosea sp. (in: a-proteobacteria) TaxID=1871050 RepID=UPI002DDCB48F|nr:(2Fe-2S)-binding protein [Bosea sp. (in: a-proteobacteria)]HEV2510354.1 (2Fe-2S)-binding protein [Bosea sp. (in: a-proteobacteria)]